MSVLDCLRLDLVLGVPAGLLLGLLLSAPAWRPDGWGGYASWPRRATRLAHVAAIMLPALAGVFAAALPVAVLESVPGRTGAALWIAGSVALPAALLVVARRARLAPCLLPLPALSLVAGALGFACAFLSSGDIP